MHMKTRWTKPIVYEIVVKTVTKAKPHSVFEGPFDSQGTGS